MFTMLAKIWGGTRLARGLYALGSLGIAGGLLFTDKDVPAWFVAVVTMSATFYFSSRQAEESNTGS